jgi:heme exporter protein C
MRKALPYGLGLTGITLLLCGSYVGLFRTPAETYMRDLQRIMYVHVPTAWNALLAFTFAFVCALLYLWRGNMKRDAQVEAGLEVGVVFCFLLCVQGSLWAKPTWGVWWDWDPRLTTTAVMLFAFAGILALRSLVDDPVRRATWSAVATIVAYVDVPLVYFSVRWWKSLHQIQSTPQTVSALYVTPLRINAFGVLFLMAGLIALRSRLARMRVERELGPAAPPSPVATHLVDSTGGAR